MRRVYLISAFALMLGLAAWAGWHWRSALTDTVQQLPLVGSQSTQDASFSFAVIGDNEGENPIYNDLIRQIAADADIAFLLHVGDATSTGAAAEHAALTDLHQRLGLTVPVYAVPGNHDIKADDYDATWRKAYRQRWQSLDLGAVHLVLLDNAERKVGFPDEELRWLEQDLAAAYARRPASPPTRQPADPLIILAYHRPFAYPLANVLGDDETRASRKTNEVFLDILRRYPVDHIFTGHIHTSLDFLMPLEQAEDGRILRSVPVTVSGGGGQPPQSAFGGLLPEKYHALKVTIKDGQLTKQLILPK